MTRVLNNFSKIFKSKKQPNNTFKVKAICEKVNLKKNIQGFSSISPINIKATVKKSDNSSKELTRLNSIKNLVLAGVNLGHKSLKLKSACHSSVSMFLSGNRNNSGILKTNLMIKSFLRAIHIVTLIIKAGGNVLIINTNPEFSILLKHIRRSTNSPQIFYSDCYWVAGTLTNWALVHESINTFINFYDRFSDFLIKNKINFADYKKMKKKFKGFIIRKETIKSESQTSNTNSNFIENKAVSFLEIRKFDKNWKPDLIFILNSTKTEAIVKEAFLLQIPVISLVDSNTNISNITYPIPTNQDCFSFARFCLHYIIKIANKNKKQI